MIIDVTQLTTTPTHYPENHATLHLNVRNRVIIQMDEGWAFCNMADYDGMTDGEGNIVEPQPEDLAYFRYGSYSTSTDFTRFIVVAEADVPADQIFGVGDNTETI